LFCHIFVKLLFFTKFKFLCKNVLMKKKYPNLRIKAQVVLKTDCLERVMLCNQINWLLKQNDGVWHDRSWRWSVFSPYEKCQSKSLVSSLSHLLLQSRIRCSKVCFYSNVSWRFLTLCKIVWKGLSRQALFAKWKMPNPQASEVSWSTIQTNAH